MALPDHMNLLKKEYDADTFQEKVDLGAGVMRDEAGACYELPAIKRVNYMLRIAMCRRLLMLPRRRTLLHGSRQDTMCVNFTRLTGFIADRAIVSPNDWYCDISRKCRQGDVWRG